MLNKKTGKVMIYVNPLESVEWKQLECIIVFKLFSHFIPSFVWDYKAIEIIRFNIRKRETVTNFVSLFFKMINLGTARK